MISLITLHGLPKAITLLGISLVTTLPEPIILFSPIVTPGLTIVPPPIHTLSQIFIGNAYSYPSFLSSTSTGCPAVNKLTLGPIKTSFPINTSAQSKITRL